MRKFACVLAVLLGSLVAQAAPLKPTSTTTKVMVVAYMGYGEQDPVVVGDAAGYVVLAMNGSLSGEALSLYAWDDGMRDDDKALAAAAAKKCFSVELLQNSQLTGEYSKDTYLTKKMVEADCN